MDKIGPIEIKVKLNCDIPFWQAIKLRLAGKRFKIIAEGILERLLQNMDKEGDN